MSITAPRLHLPPRQWEWWGLVPALSGLVLLSFVSGIFSGLFAGVPGVLLLTTGLALLLLPGDPRVVAYMAMGGLVGLLLSLPMLLTGGFVAGLLQALLGIASFVVAGRIALVQEPAPEGVPEPETDLHMQVKTGFDEAILGYFLISARLPGGDPARRMCERAIDLGRVLEARGWDDHPERLHLKPPVPEHLNVQSARIFGHDYERLSVDSLYVPDPVLPGAEEWASYLPNRRALAWVMRHPGPTRPWLVCIHGYRMGEPWLDFSLFNPGLLHHKFGLNLLMPVLPLHGPRRIGRRSGDQYLDGDLLDLLFAQSQALWDLRRWLAWLRATEQEPQIGLYGVSLGGYNTGLLTGYERGIDFGVAAIPVVDFAEVLWRVVPPAHRAYFEAQGLNEARYRELLRPVSPLSRPTLLGRDRRFVVAASADRIVPVAQPLLLARHWAVAPSWYQGSHMSIGREHAPRAALELAMQNAGWVSGSS